MGTLLNALKALKLWQIGVLAAILVGAVGATYGVYAMVSGSGQASLGQNQQLIPVRYGNLVNQVSTNGSLVFANRATLTFGTQGTVSEVLVTEGQQVKEGQPLAKLDAATVASLERALAQARVNLRNAEDALATAKVPHTPLDLAQAESRVAEARLSLRRAQEALDTVKNGPTADDVTKAQSQVDSARVSLANAERDLKLSQKDWDSTLQTAQDAFDTALEAYQTVFSRWLGITLSESKAGLAPDTLLASWGVDLGALFNPNLRFQNVGSEGWSAAGPPPDDPITPWSESVVYMWLNMYPGPVAPTCENGIVPARGACVKKEMDDAWDAYQKAQDSLDTVQTQMAKAITSAESTIARAKESLATAEEALADLKAGPDPLEVDVKEKQLVVAQATLAKATEDLAELKASVDPLEVALREAEVALTRTALETAIQRREGATLKAPMAGTVSTVNVEAGQMVNANAAVVEVVDPTIVELDGIVDQIDILFVRVGARADVTMDALRGSVLQGTVSAIASAAQSQQGVVSYPVRIQVQVPQGVQLREGLSATASIVIREERNVLLVPLQALYGTFEKPVVKVMSNGRTEEKPVVLGNSDDYWVAVRLGLAEGEQVVMEAQRATTGQFGLGQAMRQFQGQFPGAMPGGSMPGGGSQRSGEGTRPAQPTPARR